MNRLNILFGSISYLLFGRLVTLLLGLATVRVITHYLSPEEFGFLSVLVSFQIFSGLVLINPIGQYINRHTHEWLDRGVLISKLKSYPVWVLTGGVLGAFGFMAWASSHHYSYSFSILVALLVFIMIIASTANSTLIPILNMIGFRFHFVLLGVVTLALSLLFSFIGVNLYSLASIWFLGQALGLIIGSVLAWTFLVKKIKNIESKNIVLFSREDFSQYIFPLSISTALMWLLLSGYRLLIEYGWGLEMLGLIAIGFGLANQVWGVLEALVTQFVYPYFYRGINKDKGGNGEAFYQLLILITPIYLFSLVAVLLFSEYIFVVLVDSKFYGGFEFMFYGVIFEFFRVMVNLLSNYAQVEKRMSFLIKPYLVGVVFLIMSAVFVFDSGESLKFFSIFLSLSYFVVFLVMVLDIVSFFKLHFRFLYLVFSFFYFFVISIVLYRYSSEVSISFDGFIFDVSFLFVCSLFLILFFYFERKRIADLLGQKLR